MEEEQRDLSKYECNICFDVATEPVVTSCGHLYCWRCVYSWLASNRQNFTCPVCNSGISATSIIPLFIREDVADRPGDLPQRPDAQRQQPVPNPRFNPVRAKQFRFLDPAGPQVEENVQMMAGFGFFPTLATLIYSHRLSSGETGHAPLDVVSKREVLFSFGLAGVILTVLTLIF